jgi:hypothetical protein
MPLLTDEDHALLGAAPLDDAREPENDLFYPAPADFRERLALGDLSW